MTNEYDDPKFFEQYSQMPRSRQGLKAAGEWHQLKPLFPSLEGKSVLDLGCGYGWHCRFCEDQGAGPVLGIDSSRKMGGAGERLLSTGCVVLRIMSIRLTSGIL